MSVHLMCVTSGGGVPVFIKHKGSAENLPFSTVGSLNAVHMFGKSQGMELLNCISDDYVAVWKEFYESLVFIGISTGCTKDTLEKMLECVANAVIMIVGIDETKLQRNIERLKRELRICYPVIDRILDSLDFGDAQKHSSDLVDLVETILTPENHLIRIVLDSFSDCVDSTYSCVLIHGKIAAATDNWWSLHPTELKLLSLLASVEDSSSSKDIPVFLPHKSPNEAFRFVACSLISNVQVCCLCGPTPVLEDIEHFSVQCFNTSLEILAAAVQYHPRNFSFDIKIDPGIIGLLLINLKSGKYMISRNPHVSAKRVSGTSHRLDILRTFYYRAVSNFLIKPTDDPGVPSDFPKTAANETFWCSEFHKCYAIKSSDNILCIIINSNISIHLARPLAENTLKLFLNDKQMIW